MTLIRLFIGLVLPTLAGYALLNFILRKDKLNLITSLGLESFAALRKTGASFCYYGATEAAIEAAKSGLDALVICVDNETSDLIARLEKEKISYELVRAESS